MNLATMTQEEILNILDEREKSLLEEARTLLACLESVIPIPGTEETRLLEAKDIDAAFLYRFDPLWYEKSPIIRAMMRELLGQDGDGHLSRKDTKSLLEHLLNNQQLSLDESLAYNSRGFYTSLDPSLHGAYLSHNTGKVDRWLAEAEKTARTWDLIHWLGSQYNLFPQPFERSDWGSNAIELQIRRIAACIALDTGTPDLFRWDDMLLVEHLRGRAHGPNIRPQEWARRMLASQSPAGVIRWTPEPKKYRVSDRTRIRTWTVYYLTRRGGGCRTEQAAIDIWNRVYEDTLQPQNFRAERDRMLDVTLTRQRRKAHKE